MDDARGRCGTDEDAAARMSELARLFAPMPEVLSIFRMLEQRVRAVCGDVEIRVQRTQVTFSDRHVFACASLPLHRLRSWPEHGLVVTFGLDHREDDPRVAIAIEPYPGRWTHHVLVERVDQIDDALMAWIAQAHAFSLAKRRRGLKER